MFSSATFSKTKVSAFMIPFSRNSRRSSCHKHYSLAYDGYREETPKQPPEARRINPPRFPATSPFSTVPFVCVSFCLLAAHGFTPRRCFIVPWYEKTASASTVPKVKCIWRQRKHFFTLLPAFPLNMVFTFFAPTTKLDATRKQVPRTKLKPLGNDSLDRIPVPKGNGGCNFRK